MTNLVRNYSPHLDTRSAPPTAEVHKVLGTAVEMLETFMKRWRKKYEVDGNGAWAVDEVRFSISFPIFSTHNSTSVVSTVLDKTLTQAENTSDLHALLRTSSNIIVLPELEPVLKGTGQYSALCLLYEERGEDAKLLDAWSKFVFFISLHSESSTEFFISWTGSPMHNK